mmetsp:Transcript_10421/g.23564  ORF Transcript_10421/g.23564 Transcript_10421/m.23564 type:complete len:922 (-) Transcript_10421:93-2858(-)
MAAVIIAAFKARKRHEEEAAGLDSRSGTNDLLDTNNDGKISSAEVLQAIDFVGVRVDLMVQRLKLERDLAGMMVKLPNFLVCLLCFLAALCEFSPPASVHNVHQHIGHHFHIDNIKDVHELEQIYPYIETFVHANEGLQATSFVYWCEERYADHHWDHSIHAPVWTCPSPRMHSLGLSSDSASSWTAQCTGAGAADNHCHGAYASDHTTDDHASDVHTTADPHDVHTTAAPHGAHSDASTTPDSSHRRLHAQRRFAQRRLSGGSGSSESHAVQPNPACEDNDALLQEEEGVADITCHHHAAEVCEIDLGILACPYTCGYCAPFTYLHSKLFEKPQVTMLPVVLFQTRFEAMDCHGFAETYEAQPYNPQLTLLPALDGYRNGRVLTCVDRTKHYEGSYRAEHECPHDGPAVYCGDDGIMRDTPVHYFHGIPIYPKVMIEPARDIAQMKALDWIDLYTEELTLSTMVYTEGSEIFTSVSIIFSADEAGTITGRHKLVSYRDMIKDSKTTFIVCMIVCSIGAFAGAVLSIYEMARHPEHCKWGYQLYELFSRALLFAYPLVLLISWTQQTPMAEEYDHLLHSFIDTTGIGHDELEDMLTQYFDVKTHMYEETQWLLNHRCAAYIVIYIQFLQLIFYFSAHPKMAVLTETVAKAMGNIIHFLMLFGILFVMLAFMAHWMLGEHLTVYGTYGDTVAAQGRMIYGEFIYANEADELHGVYVAMYWLYAFTFMMVVFFTLLNFFLAIIVDAFADVKNANEALVCVHGFIPDLLGLFWTLTLSYKKRWPYRRQLIEFFLSFEGSGPPSKLEVLIQGAVERDSGTTMCYPEDLMKAFPEAFGSKKKTANFLAHYTSKCEDILCSRNDESAKRLQGSKALAEANVMNGASGKGDLVHPVSPPSGAQVVLPGTVEGETGDEALRVAATAPPS